MGLVEAAVAGLAFGPMHRYVGWVLDDDPPWFWSFPLVANYDDLL